MNLESQDRLAVLVIGAGPHARRTFIPHLLELREEYGLELVGLVDLESQREVIESRCRQLDFSPRLVLSDDSSQGDFVGGHLPPSLAASLDALVIEEGVRGAIISTPPEVHKAYAMWALDRGLDILMDKPITTRPGALNDADQALGIYEDYLELRERYERLQKRATTAFSINAHRRFHPTYQKVVELISQVRQHTGCPVTSIHSSHCDGQWRLPSEIVDIDYHGYNQGFGKASHSGYHFFETTLKFFQAGQVAGKEPETAEIAATAVRPQALLHHLHDDDYRRLFKDYDEVHRHPTEDLPRLYSGFGEIDVFARIDLQRARETVGHISIDLLHNSFSQRGWSQPNHADLYKGNGRVRHEYHTLQQGPFQNIQIHSFQSRGGKKSDSGEADAVIGGNDHWDIHIFRNEAILGGDRYEKISITDLFQKQSSKLVVEEIKKGGLREFLDFLSGKIGRDDLVSNIDSHELPPAVMAGIYLSHIRKEQGLWPLVPFSLQERRFRLDKSEDAEKRTAAIAQPALIA